MPGTAVKYAQTAQTCLRWPGIHVFGAVKTWMAGPSPAMTTGRML
jgi:hypothetical protein